MTIQGTITLHHLYNRYKDDEGDILPEIYPPPPAGLYEHNHNT